jgi:hypothetical protein
MGALSEMHFLGQSHDVRNQNHYCFFIQVTQSIHGYFEILRNLAMERS